MIEIYAELRLKHIYYCVLRTFDHPHAAQHYIYKIGRLRD